VIDPNGGTVNCDPVTITGATLQNTIAGGTIQVFGAGNQFVDVDVDAGAVVTVEPDSTLTIGGVRRAATRWC
jgi:hypothetical protein